MKKVYIGIAAILIIVIGGVVGLLLRKDSAENADSNKVTFKIYDACDFLTKEKAVEILGTSAVLGQEPSPSNSDDLKVTNCVYNNNAGNFQDIVSVSMLVRSPLTQAGADSNEAVFNSSATVGNEAVDGFGQKAMWNSTTGQLNILKDKNWIIVTFGKAQPSSRSLDETKNAATALFK